MTGNNSLRDKILRGMDASAMVAIERARQTGTNLVVWKDGKIIKITPEQALLERARAQQNTENP